MRLATIRTASGTRAARLEGDELVVLNAPDVRAVLSAPETHRAAHDESGETVSAADADFATLIPQPSKVFCVGLNYRSHILEGGAEIPKFPTLFGKFTDTLIGARDEIVLPSISQMVDWEVELTVVIGSDLHHATGDDVKAGVAGYTVANDISMRDFQGRTSQWLQGKNFEHTTPIGPYLVSGDEIGDALDIEISCSVDGEVMQRDRTRELVFSAFDVVSYASQFTTLHPGDLILLGTTGGVGHARKPPVFLKAGQTVRTAIEGIGECVNVCVDEQV